MDTYLLQINKEKLDKTNLFLYSNFVERNFKIKISSDFKTLWNWSIKNPGIFWKSIWDFTKVKGLPGDTFFKESKIFSSLRGKSVKQKEPYKNLDITDADYEDIKEEEQ